MSDYRRSDIQTARGRNQSRFRLFATTWMNLTPYDTCGEHIRPQAIGQSFQPRYVKPRPAREEKVCCNHNLALQSYRNSVSFLPGIPGRSITRDEKAEHGTPRPTDDCSRRQLASRIHVFVDCQVLRVRVCRSPVSNCLEGPIATFPVPDPRLSHHRWVRSQPARLPLSSLTDTRFDRSESVLCATSCSCHVVGVLSCLLFL